MVVLSLTFLLQKIKETDICTVDKRHRLVAGKNKKNRLSDEEKRIRKQEDELFEGLKSPPVFDGHLSVMGQTAHSEDAKETSDKEQD